VDKLTANNGATTITNALTTNTTKLGVVQPISSNVVPAGGGDPSLPLGGMEKKGRFIISNNSNAVDAGKVQQGGGATATGKLVSTNKSLTRSHSAGDAKNVTHHYPHIKRNSQPQLLPPTHHHQGHDVNDHTPCNNGSGFVGGECVGTEQPSSGYILKNTKVISPKKDKLPPSSMERKTATMGGGGGLVMKTGSANNMFHFLEQMKLEVVGTDKLIKSLQTDNKLLQGKNKELEAKRIESDRMYVEERSARESVELQVRELKKQLLLEQQLNTR